MLRGKKGALHALLKSIKQPSSLSKIVRDRLRDAILSGTFEPGVIYTENSLADQLGVSRTPVREAVLGLADQGIVTVLSRRGFQVNTFSHKDVAELYELRSALETTVVAKLAANPKAYDFSTMQDELVRQKLFLRAKHESDFISSDRLFHLNLFELSGNRRMITIIEGIRDMIQITGEKVVARTLRASEIWEEHRNLLTAIQSGDSVRALEALNIHLTKSMAAVLLAISSEKP